MIWFYDRSLHTYKVPSKPIKEGYKARALSDRGYLSNFMFTFRVHGTGEFRKHKELTPTGSMVLQFAEMFLTEVESPFQIYMDSLLRSVNLFRVLR